MTLRLDDMRDLAIASSEVRAAAEIITRLVIVLVFAIAYVRVPTIRANAIAFGSPYGALVRLLMNQFVLPHSSTLPPTFTVFFVANGFIGRAPFVGLSSALAARRWMGRRHPG